MDELFCSDPAVAPPQAPPRAPDLVEVSYNLNYDLYILYVVILDE